LGEFCFAREAEEDAEEERRRLVPLVPRRVVEAD
jgi:hypothetical protein